MCIRDRYEQFVARVLESSSSASTAAQRAAASAASTAANAAQAQTAAQRTSTDSANASQCAARAEAAAARAEELVPTDGQVVSVNGKSGIVKLTAQEVGALPCPCLLYTSDAADEEDRVDLCGRRINKKKK